MTLVNGLRVSQNGGKLFQYIQGKLRSLATKDNSQQKTNLIENDNPQNLKIQ